MSQRPSAPSPAPWKESHPAHRRQSVSAPQARPREITDATAVPCRRRGIKPSPPLRSLSHHPTTPARWPSALTGALPTRPAPGRSSRLDPLAKETLPESCIEQNPPAIVRQAIFRLLNESGYIQDAAANNLAISMVIEAGCPRQCPMADAAGMCDDTTSVMPPRGVVF